MQFSEEVKATLWNLIDEMSADIVMSVGQGVKYRRHFVLVDRYID